jgi:hypothetical protein
MNRVSAGVSTFKGKPPAGQQAPVILAAPAIISGPTVGTPTLYSSASYTGKPTITITQQWKLNGSNISGATGSSYTPISGDTGGTLTVTQTLTNSFGAASSTSVGVTVTSSGTAPAFTTNPVIIGTPQSGAATSYTSGSFTGTNPVTVTQQWKLNGSNISGATSSTYTPISGDVGGSLTVQEILTNAFGSVNATSAGATVVTGSGTGAGPVIDSIGISSTWWSEVSSQRVTFSDPNNAKPRIDALPASGGVTLSAGSSAATINAALAANTIVFLSGGTYILNNYITVPSNKYLLGVAGQTITLDCHTNTVDRGLALGHNATVANIIVDGPVTFGCLTWTAADGYTNGSLMYQISVRRTGWYSLTSDGSVGFYLSSGSSNNTLVTCEAFDSWNELGAPNDHGGNSDGIDSSFGAISNTFIDVHSYKNGDDGIDMWGGSDGSNGGQVYCYFCAFHDNGKVTGKPVAGDGNGVKLGPSRLVSKFYKTQADNNSSGGWNLNPGTNPSIGYPIMVQSYGTGNPDGDYINGMPVPP